MYPNDVAELTVGWLTAVLRESEVLEREGAVSAFVVHPLSGPDSVSSQVVRLTVEYDRSSPVGPSSLIVKFPRATPAEASLGFAVGLYEREVRFYQQLVSAAGMASPKCYFAEFDPGAERFAIVLEDLERGHLAENQHIDLEDIGRAVRSVAAMHATWWNSKQLSQYEWLQPVDSPLILERIRALTNTFLSRFGTTLSEERRALLQAFPEWLPTFSERARAPRTLAHGDYLPKNLFFPEATNETIAFDWQIVGVAPGVIDVANLLVVGVDPELRRQHARALLATYADALAANGVTGYGFDSAWHDFRLACLRLLRHAITNGGMQEAPARRLAIAEEITPLLFEAIDDVGAADLI